MRFFNTLVFLSSLLYTATAFSQSKTFTENVDFDSGTFSSTVDKPANQIQLGGTPVSKNTIVWANNYYPGYVVRLDTKTGKQTGRYDAALVYYNNDPKQGATGGRPAGEICNWGNRGNCPGRITTDTNADVWIINRAFGLQGTMSKFSGDNSHCIDRNGNGKIDTSTDANGDGRIDVNNPKEYFGQNDECILTTIPVGGINDVPRGVAVDKNGKIWASTYNARMLYRYNPAEPVTLETKVSMANTGAYPYSLATGGDYLFVSGSPMVRVHIENGKIDTAPCNGCYGIVGDPNGRYGYCGTSGVARGDFVNHTCAVWNTNNDWIAPVTMDLAGNIWAGGYSSGTAYKLSPAGQLLGAFPAGGTATHGISVDFQGYIWTVNDTNHTMGKISPNGQLIGSYSLDGPAGSTFDGAPYIYSDFTGVQVNRQAPYARFGNWAGTWDSGLQGVPWSRVDYNTEPEGTIPVSSTLKVLVRAADDVSTLAVTGFIPVDNGKPIQGVVGRYVQIEADLEGPGWATPILSDVTIVGPCVNGASDMCCLTSNECDDRNPCTDDSCPAPGQACTHILRKGCCAADKDCNDENACTSDKCSGPGGVCLYSPLPGCCLTDADCTDPNLCTADKCSSPGGTCGHIAVANCCNQAVECDDRNLCTIDVCSGPGGTCGHFAKAGCCNQNIECDDKNICTDDACTGPGGTCTHVSRDNCCNSDADCDDKNLCTGDKCSGPGGVCQYIKRQGCCNVSADCDDKNACSSDECSGPGGTCDHTQLSRCCVKNADCDDKNTCTRDICTSEGGSCSHIRVEECCNVDGDCDDSNPCTDDSCTGFGGKCEHKPKGSGCCLIDTDCDDNNVCTTDICSAGESCGHQPVLGCCNQDSECPGGSCVNHICVVMGLDDSIYGDGGQFPVVSSSQGCGCSLGNKSTNTPAAFFALLCLFMWRRRSHA